MSMIKLTDSEFVQFVEYMHKNYGINLEKKRALIEGRLSNLIEQKGMKTFSEYLNLIKRNNTDEITNLLNKLTTNYTYFYREDEHFKFLRDVVLPEAEKNLKMKNLCIWSAGCSSGEEPYTVAMVVEEYFGIKRAMWNIQIIASDISNKVLSKAKEAIYPEESLKMLPPTYKTKYFDKLPDGNFQVKKKIKDRITFKVFNLMSPIMDRAKYDLILCRNVMIYFDQQTKTSLVERFYNATKPGGYLFIGHSESIQRNETKYKYIIPATYKKV